MSGNDLLGICLVTWNGGRVAADCLRAALAQDYERFFLVVVDNHSSPADRAALEECATGNSRVSLIWNDDNRGFAAAGNQAVKVALAQGARWVLVLTQDTLLPPDACRRLVEVGRSNPEVAIVGPKVVDETSGNVLSLGERVAPWLLALPRSLVRYRFAPHPYRLVQGVLGCCMLIAASCWKELGGFREDLFAYYEEVDLCLRARKKGYKVAVVPSVTVRHRGWRGFAGGFTPMSALLKSRNLILVARNHIRPWQWLVVAPSMAALFVGSSLLHGARGRWSVVGHMCHGLWLGVRGHSGPPQALVSDRASCVLP